MPVALVLVVTIMVISGCGHCCHHVGGTGLGCHP